jgi:hypothetical protein
MRKLASALGARRSAFGVRRSAFAILLSPVLVSEQPATALPATGVYYTTRMGDGTGDWTWVDPDGTPVFITGIDKVQSYTSAHIDAVWNAYSNQNETAPYIPWADDVRQRLNEASINAIGRDSDWDEAAEEGGKPGTRKDFELVKCFGDVPSPQPLYEDLRLLRYLNPGLSSGTFPFILNLHTIPRDVDDIGEGSQDYNQIPFDAPVPYVHVPDVWSPGFQLKANETARLFFSDDVEICGETELHAFGLGASPDLIGVWLANELYWGYELEMDKYPWGQKYWLRSLTMLPYNADRDWDEQAAAQFAGLMNRRYNGEISEWNKIYGRQPNGELGSALKSFNLPDDFHAFNITSFVDSTDSTSLLKQFDIFWYSTQYGIDPTAFGGIEATDSGWRINAPDSLDLSSLMDETGSPGYKKDLGYYLTYDDGQAFMIEVAEQFYSTMVEAIHQYDTLGHQIISDRFPEGYKRWPKIVKIAAKYCDVLSFNIYRPRPNLGGLEDDLEMIYGLLPIKRPLLISEFSYHADNEWGWDCCWNAQANQPQPDCIRANPVKEQCISYDAWQYPESFYSSAEHPYRSNDFRTYLDNAYNTYAGGSFCEAIVTGVVWYRAFDIPYNGTLGAPTQRNQNWGLFNTAVPGAVDPLLLDAMHDDFCGIQTAISGHSHNGDVCAPKMRVTPECTP